MKEKNADLSKLDSDNAKLKINLSKSYLDEFYSVQSEKDALTWVKSIPDGLERTLLLFLALNRVKDGV